MESTHSHGQVENATAPSAGRLSGSGWERLAGKATTFSDDHKLEVVRKDTLLRASPPDNGYRSVRSLSKSKSKSGSKSKSKSGSGSGSESEIVSFLASGPLSTAELRCRVLSAPHNTVAIPGFSVRIPSRVLFSVSKALHHPRNTHRAVQVSSTTTADRFGNFGFTRAQIQAAKTSLVGFSKPGISFRY